MPRTKKISTEDLLLMVKRYHALHPYEKITFSGLGGYVRENGYDVDDYLLRRDETVRQYIDEQNKGGMDNAQRTVVVYTGIDIDSFLKHNKSDNQLRESLLERDRYYADVAASAAKLFEFDRNLQVELEAERKKNKRLMDAIKHLKHTKEKKQEIETNMIIKQMKNIIETYIYPEVANELLRQAGLEEIAGNRVMPSAVEELKITPDTDIVARLDDISTRLMRGFET